MQLQFIICALVLFITVSCDDQNTNGNETITIELDDGISRQLPLKIDDPDELGFQPVNKRNVLNILANSQNELLVEEKRLEIEDLQATVERFYNINKNGEQDADMPLYNEVNPAICETKIAEINSTLENEPENRVSLGDLEKWKTKLILCKKFPNNSFKEMSTSAVIRLECQAGISNNYYNQIQNILKRVVNKLRAEKCEEMGWGNYFELDAKVEADREIIQMLRILVPERIIEARNE